MPLKPLGFHNSFPEHFLWNELWNPHSTFHELWEVDGETIHAFCRFLYENCHCTTGHHRITTGSQLNSEEISQSNSPRVDCEIRWEMIVQLDCPKMAPNYVVKWNPKRPNGVPGCKSIFVNRERGSSFRTYSFVWEHALRTSSSYTTSSCQQSVCVCECVVVKSHPSRTLSSKKLPQEHFSKKIWVLGGPSRKKKSPLKQSLGRSSPEDALRETEVLNTHIKQDAFWGVWGCGATRGKELKQKFRRSSPEDSFGNLAKDAYRKPLFFVAVVVKSSTLPFLSSRIKTPSRQYVCDNWVGNRGFWKGVPSRNRSQMRLSGSILQKHVPDGASWNNRPIRKELKTILLVQTFCSQQVGNTCGGKALLNKDPQTELCRNCWRTSFWRGSLEQFVVGGGCSCPKRFVQRATKHFFLLNMP